MAHLAQVRLRRAQLHDHPGGCGGLLAAVMAANADRVYVRRHFLLNSGDGTPALKWGSTNVNTEDAQGLSRARLADPRLDHGRDHVRRRPVLRPDGLHAARLSTRPDPYRNSGPYELDDGCYYPPKDHGR